MPKLMQGRPVAAKQPANETDTYLCLINFQMGMGSWGRDADPAKAVEHCMRAVKSDFNVKAKDCPMVAILWKVPDGDLHWEAESVPKWEGHEDQTAIWWRLDVEHDGTFKVDEDYKVG